jgi:hypothetical protein
MVWISWDIIVLQNVFFGCADANIVDQLILLLVLYSCALGITVHSYASFFAHYRTVDTHHQRGFLHFDLPQRVLTFCGVVLVSFRTFNAL